MSYKFAKSFQVFITYLYSRFSSTLLWFLTVDDLLSLFNTLVDDLLSLYSFTVVDMSHPVKPSLKHIELDQNREIIEIMSLDAPWHSMSSRMMILEKFTFMMPVEGRVLFEQRRSNLTKTRLLDIHSRKRLTCLVVKWITKRST